MKQLSISAILLFASTASADFTGSWKGQGSAKDSSGWKSPCELTAIQIEQTETALIVSPYMLKCGTVTSDNPGIQAELKGDEIWYDGKKVGTLSGDSLDAEVCDQGICQQWKVQKTADDKLKYTERVSVSNDFLEFNYVLTR